MGFPHPPPPPSKMSQRRQSCCCTPQERTPPPPPTGGRPPLSPWQAPLSHFQPRLNMRKSRSTPASSATCAPSSPASPAKTSPSTPSSHATWSHNTRGALRPPSESLYCSPASTPASPTSSSAWSGSLLSPPSRRLPLSSSRAVWDYPAICLQPNCLLGGNMTGGNWSLCTHTQNASIIFIF